MLEKYWDKIIGLPIICPAGKAGVIPIDCLSCNVYVTKQSCHQKKNYDVVDEKAKKKAGSFTLFFIARAAHIHVEEVEHQSRQDFGSEFTFLSTGRPTFSEGSKLTTPNLYHEEGIELRKLLGHPVRFLVMPGAITRHYAVLSRRKAARGCALLSAF